MKRETTPAKITDKIMELCSSEVPSAVPVEIEVQEMLWSELIGSRGKNRDLWLSDCRQFAMGSR